MTDTKTVDQRRTDIHRALPGRKSDQWSTAQAVAEAVGLRYSTVTEHLRVMVDAGTVAMTRYGRVNVFRKNGASPRLKKADVPVPLAAVIDSGTTPTPPRRRHGAAPPTVSEPAAAVVAAFAEEPAGPMVWMAVKRKGLNYHAPAAADNHTACGRPTHSGVYLPRAQVRETSSACRDCYRESAVETLNAPVLQAVPEAPARKARGGKKTSDKPIRHAAV